MNVFISKETRGMLIGELGGKKGFDMYSLSVAYGQTSSCPSIQVSIQTTGGQLLA